MIVHPLIYVTPDRPTIQIREPQGTTDLDPVLNRVLVAQGWGTGTYFDVQFVDHEAKNVLSHAAFIVKGVAEVLRTNESNPVQPITGVVAVRKFRQVTRWEDLSEGGEKTVIHHWNPGKQTYEIRLGELVLGEERDKEKAKAMAKAAAEGRELVEEPA